MSYMERRTHLQGLSKRRTFVASIAFVFYITKTNKRFDSLIILHLAANMAIEKKSPQVETRRLFAI